MYIIYVWSWMQIVLEMLPVSSSGHLYLLKTWMEQTPMLLSEPFKVPITYLLHLPTVCIITVFFFPQWSFPFVHIKRCWLFIAKISLYTFCADMATVGMYLFFQTITVPTVSVCSSFFLTAVSLLSLYWCPYGTKRWTLPMAVVLGVLQGLAFIPGLSRFALTFVASRWFGLSSRRAFEISFLIFWPLMFIASLYSIWVFWTYNLTKLLSLTFWLVMLISSIIASAVLYGVSLMVRYDLMWGWGIYMIIPFIICLFV